MNLISRLFSKQEKRYEIVERLLSEGKITAREAVVLLSERISITIQKVEMSSGAKIVQGDDNETSYK